VPLESGQVFNVMAVAYRHGVLDKLMSLFGEALEEVVAETGANIGDLVNKMDEAQEATIKKLDALLSRSGPLLKAAAGDRLMETVSRLLDSPLVRRVAVGLLKRNLVRAIIGEAPPSLTEKVRAMISGFAGKSDRTREEVM